MLNNNSKNIAFLFQLSLFVKDNIKINILLMASCTGQTVKLVIANSTV